MNFPALYKVANDANINAAICWPKVKEKNVAMIWLNMVSKFDVVVTAAAASISPESIDAFVVS